MFKLGYIYGLQESGTNLIRYVGQSYNLERRLAEHEQNKFQNYKRWLWMQEVYDRDGEVEMVTLETCEPAYLTKRERYWINKLNSEGNNLLNERLI